MATFTGAQGEVVVDTTNNRVVVQDGATAGGWPSARVIDLAPACGRLKYVSATQITFAPYNGGIVKIAGALYAVPSAGITAANTSVYVNGTASQNLAASMLYYVYLFNNSGTLTVNFSTTGHTTDTTAGNVGTEIESGNNTYTLIGMVYTNTSAQFSDASAFRGVASWFNRRNRDLQSAGLSAAQTTSVNAFVEVSSSSSGRALAVLWGDEGVFLQIFGQVVNTSTGQTDYVNIGDGSTTAITANGAEGMALANVGYQDMTTYSGTPSEGLHQYYQLACVTGGTGTFYTQLSGLIRQ